MVILSFTRFLILFIFSYLSSFCEPKQEAQKQPDINISVNIYPQMTVIDRQKKTSKNTKAVKKKKKKNIKKAAEVKNNKDLKKSTEKEITKDEKISKNEDDNYVFIIEETYYVEDQDDTPINKLGNDKNITENYKQEIVKECKSGSEKCKKLDIKDKKIYLKSTDIDESHESEGLQDKSSSNGENAENGKKKELFIFNF